MQTYALPSGASTLTTPWLVRLFGATILLSAVLLFVIQPMFARMILPRLGGTPATWNTCLVFFQMTLLLGYLYAHFISLKLSRESQIVVHLTLLLATLVVLPIRPPSGAPPTDTSPVWWLLDRLTTGVGFPFLMVSATAPLLQRWFTHASSRDPYFLYAASNLGSLIGLLGYPFGIERLLTLADQSALWFSGFAVFTGLIAACGITSLRSSRRLTDRANGDPAAVVHERVAEEDRTNVVGDPVGDRWRRRLSWLALSFVPSSLLLGVTTHISTDIAAVPLLWVVPLSLYLLTFIAAFAAHPRISGVWPTGIVPFFIIGAVGALIVHPPSWWGVALHLTAFSAVALVCHRALADRRPAAEHLTRFYLWISCGGAMGGVFNALIAPFVFTSVAEYPLVLALAAVLRPVPDKGSRRREPWPFLVGPPLIVFGVVMTTWAMGLTADVGLGALITAFWLCAAVVLAFAVRPEPCAVSIVLAVMAHVALPHQQRDRVLFEARSFFGVHRVVEDAPPTRHRLWHGTTMHGWQKLTSLNQCEPTSYYHRSGPIGQAFGALGVRAQSVGVIGLGAGSLACYGQPGARWTFYEIDPVVERVAQDPALFTYLRNAQAAVSIVIGDGRITLTDARPSSYDVIVVDAFSSDAIPVHLLTQEFVQVALDRLRPHGILAFHVSNLYLDLEPVMAAAARNLGAAALEQLHRSASPDASDSRWILIARESTALSALAADARWRPARPGDRSWTDDFSNILDVIAWTPLRASGGR